MSQTVTDEGQERRRRRTERGVTSNQYGQASKVPLPQRERRPILAVAAVLLIVLGAAVAGLVALRTDQRVTVIVAKKDIAVGQQIQLSDLTTAKVAVTGIALIPAADGSQVVDQYAQTNVAAGTLIDRSMVGAKDQLPDGQVAAGFALKPGQYPQDLHPGDHVDLVEVPAQPPTNPGSGVTPGQVGTDTILKLGVVLAKNALVLEVRLDANNGNNARISVAVPATVQSAVATAGSTQTMVLLRDTRTASSGGG